jgi:LPS O-antigen subunit length determinant protein (WzzB/FepE family)
MKKSAKQNKELLRINQWPTEQRRLVLWLGVATVMLVLLVFWFYSLRLSLLSDSEQDAQPLLDIQQIRQDLSDGLEKVEQNSQSLKKIEIIQATSSEDELLREENKLKLEELRQKLDQLPNQPTE